MPAFRMKPALKEYLWGGRRLKEEWGVQAAADTVAEAWVLSAHPDGESIVAEGEFAGKTLRELLSALGSAACGTHASSDIFPVLIKLIDARDRLSIQVHPDETYAMAHEGQHGKTECWVILDAAPGAFLYYGFSREVSREEFEDRIRANTLTEVLNAVEVHRGDVLTIPPGTLHAIGAGILLAEVQQSSNVTYRIYDYDRRDAQGRARDLHISQALDVTERTLPHVPDPAPHLAACPYFTVDRVAAGGSSGMVSGTVDETSFLSVLIIGGEGTLSLPDTGGTYPCRPGDSFFLPASSGSWTLTGTAEALLTRVP